MFKQLLRQRQGSDDTAKLAAVSNKTILEALEATPVRPLQKEFKPGDLITQEILRKDPSDGEPMTRYRFPLPGQPAKVVAVILNPELSGDDKGSSDRGAEDIVIHTFTGVDDKVLEFIVSSRFFRKFDAKKDKGVDPEVKAFIASKTEGECHGGIWGVCHA
jgi:hypothetical protein